LTTLLVSTPAVVQCSRLSYPEWLFERLRNNAAREWFDLKRFLDEVECSTLHKGVKETLQLMSLHCEASGLVTISGKALSQTLNVRENTVSARQKQAVDAGYLVLKRRFNKSPLRRLTWPSGDQAPPDESWGNFRSLSAVEWTHSERIWYAAFDPGISFTTPWQNLSEAPF
jgi:hypothetical protein